MRNLDFSSWQSVVMTLIGLVVITFVMVGIRLLVMQTVQQRRERENRQINERLRTLIAAYKTLGGSFTGDLTIDPTHLRDFQRRQVSEESAEGGPEVTGNDASVSSDRSRRIRDAVEAALSDVILLGTEEQVRLAARAANELAAGRATHTNELVISLRDFIRRVLDLEPVPTELVIPEQGPTRPGASGGKGKRPENDDRDGTKHRGKGAGDVAGGAGMVGLGGGLALGADNDEKR